MATEPTTGNGSRPGALGRDPVSALRAPSHSHTDLSRLSARAREELTRRRLAGESSRTVASCPACGSSVRGGDDYVRDRGALYHAGCALYRPRNRRHG